MKKKRGYEDELPALPTITIKTKALENEPPKDQKKLRTLSGDSVSRSFDGLLALSSLVMFNAVCILDGSSGKQG